MIQLVANGENLDKPIEDNGRGIVEEKKANDFKLIPLFKPLDPSRLMASKCNPLQYEIEVKKILNCWEHITKDIENIHDFTNGDMSLTNVLNDLIAGNLLLWMGFVDGKYCGFVTTRKDMNYDAHTILSIIHLFIKPGTDKQIFLNGLSELKEFAKNQKCNKLRFWTLRKGWERKLIPMGFKQSYTEYVYDLEGDNHG